MFLPGSCLRATIEFSSTNFGRRTLSQAQPYG
jgi:hypothetical protein